jgi:hypothetical protein
MKGAVVGSLDSDTSAPRLLAASLHFLHCRPSSMDPPMTGAK